MLTKKNKRKNTPRSRRLLWAAMILVLLVFGGLVAFPYVETRLNQWLEDDPFTPMCNVPHLELAYESNQDGYVRLYTMRGDGTHKIAVTERDSQVSAYPIISLSPDGQWLSYDALPLDGNSNRMGYLFNRKSGEYDTQLISATLEWSNNSRYLQTIYFDMYQPSFTIWNQEQTQSSVYMDSFFISDFEFGAPRWSPDSSRLIYSRFSDNKAIVVYPDEGFRQTILYDGGIGAIDWSPNGQYFLFTADNALQVAEFDQTTGHFIEVRQLASAMIYSVHWSPDSTQLAYFVESGEAVIQQVDNGEIVWRFNAEYFYDWSENGLIIGTMDDMYPYTPASQIWELQVVDVATQSINGYFARTTGYTNSTAQWTPDGQQIFYTFNHSDFYLTLPQSDPDGEPDFRIRASFLNFGAMWTPDNQYLTYEGDNHWLYLLKLNTHESCRVAKGNSLRSTNYDWRLIPEAEQ